MTDKMTFDEMANSLTGFEEIAIEKTFRMDMSQLGEAKPSQFLRSMVFILMKRDGLDDKAAYEKVMGMRLDEVSAHFEDDTKDPKAMTTSGRTAVESA